MSGKIGNYIDTNKLVAFFDVQNDDCYISGTTSWNISDLLKNTFNNNNFTVNSGVYVASKKALVTDGIDDIISLPNNTNTTLDWGKTLSIYCKPNPDSYILNAGSIQLYYTKTNKLNLATYPPSHCQAGWNYTNVGIDSNNDIWLNSGQQNNKNYVAKLDINNNFTAIRVTPSISYAIYSMGKISFDGTYAYHNWYNGFFKSTNLLDYSNPGYYSLYNAGGYFGDNDIDETFFYFGGYGYKVFKVFKSGSTISATYGDGTPGTGNTQCNYPRGIAVGTNYVFVSDISNHRVLILNKTDLTYNNQLGITGLAGSSDSLFNNPMGAALRNGKLYIVDYSNQRLKIYNELTLSFINSLSFSGETFDYVTANDTYLVLWRMYDGLNNTILRVLKQSDNSLVFNRTIIGASTNSYLGGYNTYGAKVCKTYEDGSVHTFDRYGTPYIINSTGLTFSATTSPYGDPGDIAIDSTHTYATSDGIYGFRKFLRANDSIVGTVNSGGTGNGQFTGYYGNIAISNTYVFVTDNANTSSRRIQIFNKSDVSYIGKLTGFTNDQYIQIYNNKLYVTQWSSKNVLVYNTTTFQLENTYTCSHYLTKMRFYNDEAYAICYNDLQSIFYIRVFNPTDFLTTKRFSIFLSLGNGSSIYPYNINAFDIANNRIFINIDNHITVMDAMFMSVETQFQSHYKYNFLDQVIPSSKLLIDIVLTSDYKVKFYVNGIESASVQYTSLHSLKMNLNSILSNYYTGYYGSEYYWIAWYNKERTLAEHTKDYNYIKYRFG